MRVKMLSHENIETLETRTNEFLATLATSDVKHVNTVHAETETVVTIWYDDLGTIEKNAIDGAAALAEPIRAAQS